MNEVDHDAELRRLLAEVPSLRLRPADWAEIDRLLAQLEEGQIADGPLEEGQIGRVEELSQVVFEARVRRRFQGARTGADVVPTKQTSALPWVGLVCGALLVGVGALLGGGVILAGIVALGVFVFAIAFAGSRVAHRGRDVETEQAAEPPVAIPDVVAVRVNALRRSP